MTPLPRGRHGLSREQVARSQRLRLLRAMAEVMAEKGYAATSVADILRRARVSRETFYELFESKQDCFMGAFEEAYGHLLDAVSSTRGNARGSRRERFSTVLRDYLEALALEPAAARVFLIEVYAAGPEAIQRRLELQAGLADALSTLVGGSDEDRFAVEALLAAVVQLVTARLAVGDVDGLRDLHDPVVALLSRLGLA
ncbi:MAG: TetR/AcrR family transcriptional regulator [Solirubrobacterales bacterium]